MKIETVHLIVPDDQGLVIDIFQLPYAADSHDQSVGQHGLNIQP